MRRATALLALLFALSVAPLLTGCAATSAPAVADGKRHAECTVCKHNADLACIDVVVDADTPHCDHAGKTYYFCSEHCCKKFQQSPATYEKE
ncbi:MAG TPA: YHS domain-containing protein [Humisphaera sp.]